MTGAIVVTETTYFFFFFLKTFLFKVYLPIDLIGRTWAVSSWCHVSISIFNDLKTVEKQTTSHIELIYNIDRLTPGLGSDMYVCFSGTCFSIISLHTVDTSWVRACHMSANTKRTETTALILNRIESLEKKKTDLPDFLLWFLNKDSELTLEQQ